MSVDIAQFDSPDSPEVAPPRPAKPRIWTVFAAVAVGLAAAVFFQAIVTAMLVFVEIAQGADAHEAVQKLPAKLTTPAWFMLLAACGQLAFGLAVVVPAWLSPVPYRERLGLLPARPFWHIYPLAMLGSLIPLAVGFGLAHALALILPPDPSVGVLLENITLADAVPFVLFIALVPGIIEELLFRGYVQRRLLRRWSPAWAIGVTTILFAIVHITPHAIVAVLPLGLWLGLVAWRSGSIVPCIFCHAFVNGGVNAWRMIVKFGHISETAQIAVVVTILLAAVVCFVLTLRYLFKSEQVAVEPVHQLALS